MKKTIKKYRYLGNVYPEISESWFPIVLEMIQKIDKTVRPWFVPLWLLNSLRELAQSDSFFAKTGLNLLEFLVGDNFVIAIKTKFASLRIQGAFSEEVKVFVKEAIENCSNTCEQCGSTHNVKETIVNNWVTNLCETCKK